MEEHEISSIENRDDDEEDSEQNADEEHQSLDHHAWTQRHTSDMLIYRIPGQTVSTLKKSKSKYVYNIFLQCILLIICKQMKPTLFTFLISIPGLLIGCSM